MANAPALLLVLLLVSGCLGASTDPAGPGVPYRSAPLGIDEAVRALAGADPTMAPLENMTFELEDFPVGADWILFKIWTQKKGLLTVKSESDFSVYQGVFRGGSSDEKPVPICLTQPTSTGLGTILIAASHPNEIAEPALGLRTRGPLLFGYEHHQQFTSFVSFNDSQVEGPQFILIGLGNRAAHEARGATAQWEITKETGNFSWRLEAAGYMQCTNSLQDFKGDLRQSPLLTEGAGLSRTYRFNQTGYAWLMGQADTELRMSIRQAEVTLAQGERVKSDAQLHLHQFQIPPGEMRLELQTIKGSPTTKPWAYSVVVGDIPAEASEWFKRQSDRVKAP